VTATNPLLQAFDLPPYSAIRPEHVEPAVDQILADNRAAIAAILEHQGSAPDWDGLVLALDELNARLGRAWSPVSHLNAVCNSAELRAAYEACLPKLSAYYTELGQNRALYQAWHALADSPAAAAFEQAQQTIVKHTLSTCARATRRPRPACRRKISITRCGPVPRRNCPTTKSCTRAAGAPSWNSATASSATCAFTCST
jgi:Zn-dependent oligopeptidase